MKMIETEFESNANTSGLHKFHQLRRGVNPKGESVYIYNRITAEGNVFGFEVFTPMVTKAGTVQKFPNGSTRTIEDDTENYPGASSFGRTAYFCSTMDRAEFRFNELMGIENLTEVHVAVNPKPVAVTPKPVKPSNSPEPQYPGPEFTMQEISDLNGIEKTKMYFLMRDLLAQGKVRELRRESRGRGRPTVIYGVVA